MRQRQFLEVLSEAEAKARFETAYSPRPRLERVALADAGQRVLAEDVRASVDVPGFDRSNVDGFAVDAADTFGAEELTPVRLQLLAESIAAGRACGELGLQKGETVAIATGGAVPRGANAVVMVEDTSPTSEKLLEVYRAVAPGAHVTSAGTDLSRGEVVLSASTLLTSREIALLAAIGVAEVTAFARPRVAVLSTGDEIRAAGEPLTTGEIHDANGPALCEAVAELGGKADFEGIFADHRGLLGDRLRRLLKEGAVDVLLLSGGTSKGEGDLNYSVVQSLASEFPGSPGIVVHGVALKPGKPLCLAVLNQIAVIILPGFPTSALFTFHEFVAPLLCRLSGRRRDSAGVVSARAPLRIPSAVGRTEYCLVDLVPGKQGLSAYPIGAGSGSVRTFARADGYVRVDAATEFLAADSELEVTLLGSRKGAADLIAIGSHCIGLDWLFSELSRRGFTTKAVAVGSRAGLAALLRGEGDLAGCHLLDEKTGLYNTPFLGEGQRILGGYGRRQGLVWRRGDPRLAGKGAQAIHTVVRQEDVRMVNRNPGSGTRVLIDRFLGGYEDQDRPEGYHTQVTTHHAVAAAVQQGRADWGITLDTIAADNDLDFCYLQEERFDLVVATQAAERPALQALADLLDESATITALKKLGLQRD
jgi:putative molybdopterin biosynthesis protein